MKQKFLIKNEMISETIHEVSLERQTDRIAVKVDQYYILEILDKGYVRRVGKVPSFIGLELNGNERVRVKDL